MTVHMRDRGTTKPVCKVTPTYDKDDLFVVTTEIDLVDCVICLRRLVKDAVFYGVARRARRGW